MNACYDAPILMLMRSAHAYPNADADGNAYDNANGPVARFSQ